VPDDLQVITPTPDESPDLQQEFPDELASTGFGGLVLLNRAFRRLALQEDEK
jgi:hypothetical protein